jgi:hypothetical protein
MQCLYDVVSYMGTCVLERKLDHCLYVYDLEVLNASEIKSILLIYLPM